MFDSNKKYTVGVYDLSFMLIDEEDNILSHPDGRTMEFTIPNYDCSYLGDGVEVNDLVLRQSNPTQKWTHDFSFSFTVNTHQSDPDKISPEIIVDRFMDTVQNMSREEIFERSECYNSFAEELDNENDKQINNSMMRGRDTFITSEINRQKFFDLLWQAVKDTNLNFEELLDDDGEGSVFVKFTGVKNENN